MGRGGAVVSPVAGPAGREQSLPIEGRSRPPFAASRLRHRGGEKLPELPAARFPKFWIQRREAVVPCSKNTVRMARSNPKSDGLPGGFSPESGVGRNACEKNHKLACWCF